MTNRAKLHKKWDGELARKLEHINWCEWCGTTSATLTKAHRVKKRFIGVEEKDHQEYLMAAKLCMKCHDALDNNVNRQGLAEFDAHRIMFDTITKLIEGRD